MKKMMRRPLSKTRTESKSAERIQTRLLWASAQEEARLLAEDGTPQAGFSPAQAAKARQV